MMLAWLAFPPSNIITILKRGTLLQGNDFGVNSEGNVLATRAPLYQSATIRR